MFAVFGVAPPTAQREQPHQSRHQDRADRCIEGLDRFVDFAHSRYPPTSFAGSASVPMFLRFGRRRQRTTPSIEDYQNIEQARNHGVERAHVEAVG